jgi:hypothetical protein
MRYFNLRKCIKSHKEFIESSGGMLTASLIDISEEGWAFGCHGAVVEDGVMYNKSRDMLFLCSDSWTSNRKPAPIKEEELKKWKKLDHEFSDTKEYTAKRLGLWLPSR